jgi:hypothetical protein
LLQNVPTNPWHDGKRRSEGRAIAAVTVGVPDIIAMRLFLRPLPYILTAVVGVVRSANKYEEAPEWGPIAKIAVVVWVALMVFV